MGTFDSLLGGSQNIQVFSKPCTYTFRTIWVTKKFYNYKKLFVNKGLLKK